MIIEEGPESTRVSLTLTVDQDMVDCIKDLNPYANFESDENIRREVVDFLSSLDERLPEILREMDHFNY
jgi:hypothetical protein